MHNLKLFGGHLSFSSFLTTHTPFPFQAALHHHWTDPNLPSEEAFLRDYILNRGYIDKEADRYIGGMREVLRGRGRQLVLHNLAVTLAPNCHRIPTYNELVADSDQPSDSEVSLAEYTGTVTSLPLHMPN